MLYFLCLYYDATMLCVSVEASAIFDAVIYRGSQIKDAHTNRLDKLIRGAGSIPASLFCKLLDSCVNY